MNPHDKTERSQTERISFELELFHPPEKVWRALTDPQLLSEWLLPIAALDLQPGAEFRFTAPPQPEWDGIVNGRILEADAPRKLSYELGAGRTLPQRDPARSVDGNEHRRARLCARTRPPRLHEGARPLDADRGGRHCRGDATVLRAASRFG
ncbi:MAG: SRPBCC domain-containing protein [Candidatus Eisenbacteria bacterium]|nr:SRPBCC domain-containing protein [Candidatus Eisenbacteria bacterium]